MTTGAPFVIEKASMAAIFASVISRCGFIGLIQKCAQRRFQSGQTLMCERLCIIIVPSAMNACRIIIPDEPHPAPSIGQNVEQAEFRHAALDHFGAKAAMSMTKSIRYQGRLRHNAESWPAVFHRVYFWPSRSHYIPQQLPRITGISDLGTWRRHRFLAA